MISRYYNNSKSSSKPGREAIFPLFILLACLAYAHKTLAIRIEHLMPVIFLIVIGVISLAIISKLVFRVLGYIKLHNPDMTAIDKMTGLEFERYIAGLLKNQGYTNVRLTEKYDLGVDIIAVKDGIRWGIQVKRYSGLVKTDAIRQVVTALRSYNCNRAMVVTNSTFSQTTKELARSNDCVLIDRNILMRWSIGHHRALSRSE